MSVTELPHIECMTKRSLVSDVAKTFDALGWYSPTIVKAKVLLQTLWLEGIGWDECVPDAVLEEWSKWRRELPLLSTHCISRCYYPKEATIVSTQLHGFSDASEKAYAAAVYLRMEDTNGVIHTSLVISKTRVAPIKRVTIPRLELNGTLILAQLLFHCKQVLDIPLSLVYAWTDSTIVLAWLKGNPHRFKVYVGNRVAQILELIPADRWSHVVSEDNPANCASQGIFPSELLAHNLWWNGPSWVKLQPHEWPKNDSPANVTQEEGEELNTTTCTLTIVEDSLLPVDKLSSFNQYKRVTAWIIRFIHNCKAKIRATQPENGPLTTEELNRAANYWYSVIQRMHFPDELRILTKGSQRIPTSSKIYSLNPLVDDQGIMSQWTTTKSQVFLQQ